MDGVQFGSINGEIIMKFVIATVLGTVLWLGGYQSVMAQSNSLNNGKAPPLDVNVVNNETSPVPVTIQNGGATIVEYRYIGSTAATTDGKAIATTPSGSSLEGVAALNRMCAIEYGEGHPGVRAATQYEARMATDHLPPTYAWVVATPLVPTQGIAGQWVAVDSTTGGDASHYYDSPDDAFYQANCRQYTRDSALIWGPTLRADGRTRVLQCDNENAVACVAPVVILVGQ